jgi:hypothetical protein
MPKFADGYQTTLGKRTNTLKLSDALNVSLIQDNLLTSSLDVKKLGVIYPVFITPLQDSEEKIPLFTHPFYFQTRDGKQVIATDMRMVMNGKIYNGSLSTLANSVRSKVEFDFARSRAILNMYWLEQDVESLKTRLWFSTAMFARTISDVLNRGFALDPRDQQIVSIVACYYYQSLFSDQTNYDEDTIQKWQIHTSKCTSADKDMIMEIFAKMPPMTSIQSMVDGLRIATENVRLNNLNLVNLLNLMRNIWLGINAKDIITIAVEHPPTWMAVVYAALNERTFRKTNIYQIAERIGRGSKAEDYLTQYNAVLADYEISETGRLLGMEGIVDRI